MSPTLRLSYSLRQTSQKLPFHQISRSQRLSTSPRIMASNPPTEAGRSISETAKAEGGSTQGSTSAQMQSDVGKTRNFEQAAQDIGAKMANEPEAITHEDANYLKSREARATGQAQPPKDSLSAEAQRLASANERGGTAAPNNTPSTSSTGGIETLSSAEQSQLTKQQNFQEAIDEVGSKMENDPGSVTKEDGDVLHRREQRAQGVTEKGGIAAQAQRLAAENKRATK